MANENVPTPAPTRSDDQILPFAAWVPIKKRNHVLDLQKSPTKKGRKDKPHVIPYCRFTKLIICHLGRIHNINQRSASLFHLAEEDSRLGNLKFVSKGEINEVFGMPIPNELILTNIRNTSYYNAYLEMVAKHDQKVAAEKEGKKKSASSKQLKPKPAIEKSSKPAPAPKPKVTKEKSSKASTAKPPKPKPAKEKLTKATLLQKAGKGKVVKVRNVKSTFQLVDEPDEEPAHSEPVPKNEQESAGEEYDMEHAIQMSLELFQDQGYAHIGGVGSKKTSSGGDTKILLDQTCETHESRTPPVQFINDKSTDDELGKLNVEAEVVSMVIVPIYQASSSVPPLSTPVINLLHAKPTSSTTQAPIFTATTTTTQTTLPPPPQQQSTTKSELAERVAALEKKLLDLEQTNKNLDNTTQNLGSKVYTLELRDLPLKINEVVRENVKEAVQIALQAPLRYRIRNLSEEDMKEMLHQRMFESGTYKSLPEHITLYEALEASMARAQRDEFLAKKDKSPSSSSVISMEKSDTRDALSSSSKQQSGPHDEQPVKDIRILDSANISDSEDTSSAHHPHVQAKQR
ncbi:hypothetical protein Tco_0570949 [Tanacetum coccineum]